MQMNSLESDNPVPVPQANPNRIQNKLNTPLYGEEDKTNLQNLSHAELSSFLLEYQVTPEKVFKPENIISTERQRRQVSTGTKIIPAINFVSNH